MSKKKNKNSNASDQQKSKEKMESKSGDKYKKWLVPIIIVLAGVLIALNAAKSFYTAAVVNGDPIYRYGLITELENQYGKQLLDNMITEKLILQRAEDEGMTVSQEEIDQEVTAIEENVTAQGQTLENLLAQQGLTRERLRYQIRIQRLVDKMAPEPESPSEEEINEVLEQQADSFPEEMTEDERRQAVIDQLTQQKRSETVQNFIQSLRESAEIEYLGNY